MFSFFSNNKDKDKDKEAPKPAASADSEESSSYFVLPPRVAATSQVETKPAEEEEPPAVTGFSFLSQSTSNINDATNDAASEPAVSAFGFMSSSNQNDDNGSDSADTPSTFSFMSNSSTTTNAYPVQDTTTSASVEYNNSHHASLTVNSSSEIKPPVVSKPVVNKLPVTNKVIKKRASVAKVGYGRQQTNTEELNEEPSSGMDYSPTKSDPSDGSAEVVHGNSHYHTPAPANTYPTSNNTSNVQPVAEPPPVDNGSVSWSTNTVTTNATAIAVNNSHHTVTAVVQPVPVVEETIVPRNRTESATDRNRTRSLSTGMETNNTVTGISSVSNQDLASLAGLSSVDEVSSNQSINSNTQAVSYNYTNAHSEGVSSNHSSVSTQLHTSTYNSMQHMKSVLTTVNKSPIEVLEYEVDEILDVYINHLQEASAVQQVHANKRKVLQDKQDKYVYNRIYMIDCLCV